MKKLPVAALLLFVACASTDTPEPMPPLTPAPDPRVAQLQTSLTELLERIDVLNERMARLESGAVATVPDSAPARAPEPEGERVVQAQPQILSGGAIRPAAPTQPELPPAPVSQPALASAKLAEEYRQAIILFGRGRHSDARRAFQEVFESDTNGDLADNALFWIGETYYAAADYTNAVRFYNRVVSDYSEENKAPDALLKIALAQERTGDLALARKTLQRVIEQYPYSSTASTAKAELQRIRF
jgi:tol-pal system protein YbgF